MAEVHYARTPWKPVLDAELRFLWNSGRSIVTIAAMLRMEGHEISRNAVAGRRRRLNLPARGSPIFKSSVAGGATRPRAA